MSDAIEIVEVSPRDGLQNEHKIAAVGDKIELISRLAHAGLRRIEITACVSPARVPQMADHAEVIARAPLIENARYAVLAPNERALRTAIAPTVFEVAVLTAASEAFNLRNLNCDTDESLRRAAVVITAAKRAGKKVRGYISTVITCPFEGDTPPPAVARIAESLVELGCDELSLGDTIGAGAPADILKMLKDVASAIPIKMIAIHCHDTCGQALANIRAALDFGVRVVDCSVAGLGGCPFAPGASGNVATEDVVYMMQREGLAGEIDFDSLVRAGEFICNVLDRRGDSKAAKAYRARKKN